MNCKFQRWLIENEPDDKMLYKPAYWDSNIFLRDKILPLFFWDNDRFSYKNFHDFEAELDSKHDVIGVHRSKSIRMPVLRFEYRGWIIVLRYNFYNYEIAVIGERDIELPRRRLFSSEKENFYYEGFPLKYRLTERYEQNQKQFMAQVGDHYSCYTFFFLLKQAIDNAA